MAQPAKYNCAIKSAGNMKPDMTYTITEEDAAAGRAVFSLTFTETPTAGGEAVVTTLTSAVDVEPAASEPEPAEFLNVSLRYSGDLKAPFHVGDRLAFEILVKNISAESISAIPTASNLTNVVPAGTTGYCRYQHLPAGDDYICSSGFHVVTDADLTAGTFTPSVTFQALRGGYGGPVVETDINATMLALDIVAGERPAEDDPATIPH